MRFNKPSFHLPKLKAPSAKTTKRILIVFAVMAIVLLVGVFVAILGNLVVGPQTQSTIQTPPVVATTKPTDEQSSLSLIRLIWLIPIILLLWLFWGRVHLPGLPSTSRINLDRIKSGAQLLLGLAGCHALVWFFWPSLYLSLLENILFWIDHAVIFLTFLFLRKRGRSGGLELTAVGSGILLILVVGNIWTIWKTGPSVWTSEQSDGQRSVTTAPRGVIFPTIPQDNPVAVATDKFWRENLGPEDAALMIAIAQEESGFRQFSPDGTILRNESSDIGVMQINEKTWLSKAEELGYNIYTPEGNLVMALWIWQNHGPTEWTTHAKARSLVGNSQEMETVIAPVGDWSDPIRITAETVIRPHGQAISILDSNGKIHEDNGDGQLKSAITSPWVRVQSRTSESVKVTVSR